MPNRPVFKVEDQVVDVWVASDAAMKSAAIGPTAITVTAPADVAAQCIARDQGFGYSYSILIVTSSKLRTTETSTPVIVTVCVPSTDGSLPVQVNRTPRSLGPVADGDAQGLANQLMTLRTA